MGYSKWTDEEEQLVDPINTLDWIRGMSGKYRRKLQMKFPRSEK